LFKEVDGVKTYFLYTDEGLVGEYDENGVEIKSYGYNPDSVWTTDPLFQKTSGSYYWYQNDELGTPQKLTDGSGNVVWEAFYKTFGEAQVETALIDNNLRFPGQYFDSETELHYNYLRDYDPSTGRYLQFDPIGLEGGLNGYVYAQSDPVNLYDPTGEIVPIIGIAASQYARCIAACAAANVIANAIGGIACGFAANNCWTSCLNPLNWGGRRPKMGKPRKKGKGKNNSGSNENCGCQQLNSFPADTLVHTENGLKLIEEVKVGDKVLSIDESREITSYQPVTDLLQSEQQYRLTEIMLDSGKSIEATAEHPFYIKGKGWNPASTLKVGHVLELHDGTTVVIKEIDIRVRRDLVYNFTVANTYNYFVGRDGVLVHNANPYGKRGCPAHQAVVANTEKKLNKKGWNTDTGGSLPERKVGNRFPDLTMTKGNKTIAIQVGKVTKGSKKKKVRPISRERRALNDLRQTGKFAHVCFLRY
jgi:RHS repeat-associated protein